MKKMGSISHITLLLLLVLSLAAGCAGNGETASRTKATVIQVNVEYRSLLVELDEDSFYGSVQAIIPVDDPEKFEAGDRITFYVGGDILEMSPLIITAPRDVKKIPW